jgi:hypothetical protein
MERRRRVSVRPALAAMLTAALIAVGSGLAAGAAPVTVVPSVSDVDFVAQQYHDLLGRSVDPGGMGYWLWRLRTGTSRAAMADHLMHSSEFDGVVARAYLGRVGVGSPESTVTSVYIGLLRRLPDAGGLIYWSAQLRRGVPAVDLTGLILSSAEYDARMRAGEWAPVETFNGSPVRWNPCQPIRYVTNLAKAPSFARVSLNTAISQVEQASGLDLVWAGNTSELPSGHRSGSDVLVAFASAEDFPMPAGAAGWGKPRSVPTATGGRVYASGQVVVRPSSAANPWTEGVSSPNSLERFLMHELGHLVGLDHVDRTTEMMTDLGYGYPPGWGPGDRRGLAALGRPGGCITG